MDRWYSHGTGERLHAADARILTRLNAPLCPDCGERLRRLSQRELVYPYQWRPFGWICIGVGHVYTFR